MKKLLLIKKTGLTNSITNRPVLLDTISYPDIYDGCKFTGETLEQGGSTAKNLIPNGLGKLTLKNPSITIKGKFISGKEASGEYTVSMKNKDLKFTKCINIVRVD